MGSQTTRLAPLNIAESGTKTHHIFFEFIFYVGLSQLYSASVGKGIKSETLDLTKLIKLCEELNTNFADQCYLAVTMLTRAILDHVPPIFGKGNFKEVANHHGGTSFKEAMKHLDESSRKIGNSYLHQRIRRKETLPNRTQVNFSQSLDVLLGEIVRILK
jgi:hypothetical protein